MGHRFALQERAEPTQQPSDSSGLFSTWQRGPALPLDLPLLPPNPTESQLAGGLADRGGVC